MKTNYLSLSQRLTSNLYILSAREAFIALIPYLILTSSLTLIATLLTTLSNSDNSFINLILKTNQGIYSLFPLLTLMSLSYYLAKNLNLARMGCLILSIVCFISIESQMLLTEFELQRSGQFAFHPTAIILPFIIAMMMNWLKNHSPVTIISSRSISSHLRHHINLIIPYAIIFIVITLASYFFLPLIKSLMLPMFEPLTHASDYMQALIRIIAVHLLWFLGIHGDNTYSLLVDSVFLGDTLAPNMMMGDLINFFVLTGGSGSGWSLIIAILIFSKDDHSRHIAKISTPYAIFNINELLIFGLPIVFNPYLIIPFILVPLLTFSCSILAAGIGIIEFQAHSLSWITPPIINTYIASNGDISTVLFQAGMIVLGTLVYTPFIKISHLYNDDKELAETLASKLSLEEIIEKTPDQVKQAPAQALNNSNINNIIEEILTGDLQLKYQPQVHSKNTVINDLSAHLQLRRSDGKVIELDFLHDLHRDNVSNVIYTWMLNRIKDDIDEWAIKGFKPQIHIPLESNILRQSSIIERIIQDHQQEEKHLCITLHNRANDQNILNNINLSRLRESAFEITLADFAGTEINIEALLHTEIDTIEMSQEFFIRAGRRHESELFLQVCKLCKNMGFNIKISGINNANDAKRAKEYPADIFQGDYYSPALPCKEIYQFCSKWNKNAGGADSE